jgi:2-polyprenyl-3-methyl-5-hydroxy-6-metoxy-1,4-benzoquinol methylase
MKNIDTVHHWDIDSLNYGEIYRDLRSWANTPGFRIMKREILNHFKTFEKIRFVELGAGIGKMSILMNILGGKTTLIDYNKSAIEQAEKAQRFFGCAPEFLLENALALPRSIYGQYDVVMSFGVAEHFLKKERTAIFHSHHNLAKNNGMVIIWVPNAFGLFYRFSHRIRKTLGKWPKGLTEVPFTRRELRNIASKVGLKNIKIFCGGRFLRYFNYFLTSNVKQAIRKYLLRKKDKRPLLHAGGNPREKLVEIISRNETRQGFLDRYFSYPLLLIALKSNKA